MKEGQYYYRPIRSLWGIWQYHKVNNVDTGTFIQYCGTKEEASREVYRLNGWNVKQ